MIACIRANHVRQAYGLVKQGHASHTMITNHIMIFKQDIP